MFDENKLGKRIQEARKAVPMTGEQLAERVDLSVGFLRDIERGARRPSLETLVSMANVLGVSADRLLCDSIDAAQPIVLSGIAKKLEGLPKERISFIENIVEAMIDSFKEVE